MFHIGEICNQESWDTAPGDEFPGCRSSFEECRKCIADASTPYTWLAWGKNEHCYGLTQEPGQRWHSSHDFTLCYLYGGKYFNENPFILNRWLAGPYPTVIHVMIFNRSLFRQDQ